MDNVNFSSSFITKEEYEAAKAWGLLASINLYGCNKEKITTPAIFKEFLAALTKEIDMKAHGEPLIDKFAEGHLEGYSVLQFIETSSITIHFDDKMGDRAFIDIFSCKSSARIILKLKTPKPGLYCAIKNLLNPVPSLSWGGVFGYFMILTKIAFYGRLGSNQIKTAILKISSIGWKIRRN